LKQIIANMGWAARKQAVSRSTLRRTRDNDFNVLLRRAKLKSER